MNAHLPGSTESSVRKQEPSLLSEAIGGSPAGLCVVESTGRISFANHVAEQLLDLRRCAGSDAERPEWSADGLMLGLWLGANAPYQRILRTKKPVQDGAHAIEWANGRRAVVCVHAVPLLDDQEALRGVAFTFLDVTAPAAREERSEELRQDRERMARESSLSTLAGAVAHEFNNLLAGILGETELALQTLNPRSPAHAHVARILTTAKRAADVTQQLLSYSGKGRSLPRPVRLSTALLGLRPHIRTLLSPNISLRWELAPDLPPIEVEHDQLSRCIEHLTLNAAQAMARHQHGTVRIRAAVHDIDAAELRKCALRCANATPGRYAIIEVCDDGQGMEPPVQQRMFEPFFSTKAPGRGLGLATVAGLVRRHGGFVAVHSAASQGTTIRIGLPVREVRNGSTARHSSAEPAGPLRAGVLIVDDTATVRNVAAMLLARAGATTYVAGDGDGALALYAAEHEHIDVALVDISMPGMNGIEVMTALRAQRPRLPVVLMSGHAAGHVFQQDALTRFLAKPFHGEQLLQCLRAVLADGARPDKHHKHRG